MLGGDLPVGPRMGRLHGEFRGRQVRLLQAMACYRGDAPIRAPTIDLSTRLGRWRSRIESRIIVISVVLIVFLADGRTISGGDSERSGHLWLGFAREWLAASLRSNGFVL